MARVGRHQLILAPRDIVALNVVVGIRKASIMDTNMQIAKLKEEVSLLKKSNAALAKNNRNWRRKCQKLRSKNGCQEQQATESPVSSINKHMQTARKVRVDMNYFISDLHFLCNSQTQAGINYDNRPFANTEEMNNYILRQWNKKVTNGDTVYILGDVSLRGKNDELVSLVARLNGKKVLIVGNHDDLSDYRYRMLFHDVCHYKEVAETVEGKTYKLVLFHYPILMWNGQHRGTILLYGHTHNSSEEDFFQNCIKQMNEDENLLARRVGDQKIVAINVGCMHPWMNYEPRTLEEILNRHEDGRKVLIDNPHKVVE